MTFEPKAIQRWETPKHYAGAEWPEYYVGLGKHRDSGPLERSNFDCFLKALGGESETVHIVREGHWAVGWVEWIAIHETNTAALTEADEMLCALSDYPVLDDMHYSELETDEANEVWADCYNDEQRLEYIRLNRDQFDFNSLSEVLAVVRGRYFNGYASELIY